MRDQGKDPALQEWAERGLPKLRLISQAAEVPRPRDGDMAYADGTNWNPSAQGAGIYWYGLGSWYRLATGAGITLVDGDKGDVVVSGTGLTWTIDSNAVSFAKMQDIATDKLIGRATAGSGDPEEITCTAAGRALLDDASASAQRTTLGLGTIATHAEGEYQFASGWPLDADGNYAVSLSYDAATQKVTITPTGADFTLYVRGQAFTITGTHESVAHDSAAGTYFYYHNGSGFVWSTDPWPFDEAPICFVLWTGSDGVGYFELHTTSRDPNMHRNLHYSQGTQLKTRGALSGYTLATDSDAGVTFGIAETVILDEDIQYTLTALTDGNGSGGNYTVWYRTTSGAWTFSEGNDLPFLYGTYPQWNNTSTWALQDVDANYYVNYFLFAVPALETQQQFILIPGQQQHATLAGAQAASLANLSFGNVPFQEIAPMYKITFGAKNSYGGTAKCRIEAVESLVGSRIAVAAAATGSHNALSGIQGGTTAEYYHLTAGELTNLQLIYSGTGTPEGAVTAAVGSLFLRTDGGTSTTLYVKESGTGNTGWVAK